MSLPRAGAFLLALSAIVWPACGGRESGERAGASHRLAAIEKSPEH